ncbi:hypothetical protein EMIHUDRAFT_211310 [Emiliania huxleyi CCMP1516]|uniref:CIDE-N domain-containing protein n=2 Tax=Emiliania huxleyi TaxID=2903 RepID=A0A0D3IWS3_EMIH1|nr:hypothetical protein EMIHUDRAFT_211310 [Emiliania huxleyi CCMP1516]EOD15708.1 hypothetical protein EMIHUDRAFT_211310 [Emiliania huxleyi CCMP1516]|eukprot:XP_005768137.1 hypothetical protein EMIHUDRAFT_211310 [Emiliania huxleyi CCMP1516]
MAGCVVADLLSVTVPHGDPPPSALASAVVAALAGEIDPALKAAAAKLARQSHKKALADLAATISARRRRVNVLKCRKKDYAAAAAAHLVRGFQEHLDPGRWRMLTTWLERSPTLAAALQAATGDLVDGEDGSEAEAAEAVAGLARAPAQALGRAPLVEGGGKGNGVVVSVAATVVDDDASDAGSSGSAAWVDAEAIEVDADEAIGAAGGASELFIAASATPPPPAGWEWPRKGDEIEVDEDGLSTVCRRATVTAVMADGWFQAVARSPSDEAVCHWFTWREEGTDWRRAAPSPLATSAPLSAPRGRLCGNTHERVGGAFGCILPAGHAGPHDYAPRRERRSAKRPLDASATAGPACRRALHLAVVSETALVSMHRRVLIVRRVGQSTGCQINFPQSHAELLSKASDKLQLTTPATLCFTETGDLVLADDFETIESGDTTYVSCGEPWVPPEQATQGFAKRKHGLLSELAQDGKVSLHDADAAIQDRIKNEASPILNKACDATKHTVLLRLGDQGCKWGYEAMESAVSPAFDSLLETEPLFKDVLAEAVPWGGVVE